MVKKTKKQDKNTLESKGILVEKAITTQTFNDCDYGRCYDDVKTSINKLGSRVRQDVKENPIKTGAVVLGIGIGLGIALKTIHYNIENDRKRKAKKMFYGAMKTISRWHK